MNIFKELLQGIPLENLLLYVMAIFAVFRTGKGGSPSSLLQILEMLRNRNMDTTPKALLSTRKRKR